MNRKERRRQKKIHRKSGEPKPDAVPFLEHALEYLQSGRLEQAIAHYHSALEIDPDHAPAHNNLGVALKQLGRTQEAVTHFNKALKKNPRYGGAQQPGRCADRRR